LKGDIERRARGIFDEWRAKEMRIQTEQSANLLFQEWAAKEETRIREDAVRRSEAVIKGKITEHLIPFFPEFKYDPKDARFIGTPIDLIVFDGLSEGTLRQVVFVEVKTGKMANLTGRERLVRDCVSTGKVGYEVIRLEAANRAVVGPAAPS
jgi:predicted Holliday junction resolvase-like endonuclease